MSAVEADRAPARRTLLLQTLCLLGLTLLLYRGMFANMLAAALDDSEKAHLLAMPLFVLVLFMLRRDALARAVRPGSAWGLALVGLGFALYFVSTWPFNYLQPRRMSVVPIMAGAILWMGGWRVLRLCLPMLFIVLVAIPIGLRFYARLIIMPETLTLRATQATLDLWPGTMVQLQGLDLTYDRVAGSGAIALGEPHRGASLFLAMLTIGLFVTFCRVRPLWHVIVSALLAGPIILLCNYLRLVIWGIVTIAGGYDPLSGTPRTVASLAALVLTWFLFSALVGVIPLLSQSERDGEAPCVT